MLRPLIDRFRPKLYIQLWENRIRITETTTAQVFEDKPLLAIETDDKGQKSVSHVGAAAAIRASANVEVVNPFSHPRVLLADFHAAVEVLRHGITKLLGERRFTLSPRVVIHPMEKTEGGLSNVEHRAYQELAVAAGAQEVIVHTGPELHPATTDFQSISAAPAPGRL